jgi:hypothetical protein
LLGAKTRQALDIAIAFPELLQPDVAGDEGAAGVGWKPDFDLGAAVAVGEFGGPAGNQLLDPASDHIEPAAEPGGVPLMLFNPEDGLVGLKDRSGSVEQVSEAVVEPQGRPPRYRE